MAVRAQFENSNEYGIPGHSHRSCVTNNMRIESASLLRSQIPTLLWPSVHRKISTGMRRRDICVRTGQEIDSVSVFSKQNSKM